MKALSISFFLLLSIFDFELKAQILVPQKEGDFRATIEQLLNENNFVKVIELCNEALNKDNKNYDALISRGIAYRIIGEEKSALFDFSKAIMVRPESSEAFYQRALAYNQMGSVVEAKIEIDEALRLSPLNNDYVFEKGLNLIQLESYEEAIEVFGLLIQKDPKNYLALYNRAFCFLQTQKPDLAVKDFSASIEIKPSAEAYFQRGFVKESYKKYNDAILDYNLALSIDSGFTKAKFHRGMLLLNTGNKKGYIDLVDLGMMGEESALNAIKKYKNSHHDSLLVYQAPEILVEALKPEYQEAITSSKIIISKGINSITFSPFRFVAPLPFVNPNLPGLWTVNEGECFNIMTFNSSSKFNIYCLVYFLTIKVKTLNDPKCNSILSEIESLVHQIDNIRINNSGAISSTSGPSLGQAPQPVTLELNRIRNLVNEVHISLMRLQSRIRLIQELTAVKGN